MVRTVYAIGDSMALVINARNAILAVVNARDLMLTTALLVLKFS